MPSDASGNYSLPPGYLAVTGQTIQASQHNPPLEDLGTSMTQRVMTTGATPMTGPLKLPNGSAAAPSMTFASATNVGFYRTAGGIGVSVNGALVFELTSVSSGVPVGAIMDWGVGSAPTGWLLCQGQSLLISSYPALFSAIGGAFGQVDGNHFSVPDLRGLVTAGWDQGAASGRLTGADTLRNVIGVESAALTQAQLPSYTLPNTLGVGRTGGVSLSAGATNAINSGTGAGANLTGGGGGLNVATITVNDTQSFSISGSVTSGGSGSALSKVQPTMILAKIIFAGA